ncbi:bifunctional phosphoribosyl-AMP cyclohydrolase/phosphoribosyl-ATP diphosphatase HisIE [Alkalicoccobacillus gibsonii]|uniref:bifunctional phosphoribosyl-AMP cyclohydrolase/phosphoribosyl-ATP diphosphatase HisIE n=1 Tax=Alkalicoccobacillus gibsonii TaxID=79881 RepID=UPI001932ED77|nr:bifunctional phosphoribosyl-AMP cyclohydrolase/phosphoribosyl-ATP diphosphatase HisIE [Alkalicoccobacillus gibsonii]MBM0066164.1 bifunctional phosphoribosyl-AMP cyclohydrolase/phosphoribosyl-ATP diphosphatase HisIE [Alkalicoccobacillus gibsonii]
MNIETIQFDEKGLVPAIVQDAASKEVLTLAYMNQESLTKSLETKETWFFSRSRQELWHKGETSGNTQKIQDIRYDCDQDALLVLVTPEGPACHKGTYTCFSSSLENQEVAVNETDSVAILSELERIIAQREVERPEGAYTTYLFEKGVDKILKKVGEESAEVIIAAKNRDREELTNEAADLLYHLFVLLREQKVSFSEVTDILKARS